MQTLAYGQLTDQGRVRENNEDAFCAVVLKGELFSKKGALFAVADGLGGLSRGEVASRMAVDWVREFFAGEIFFPKDPEWLRTAFDGANRKIFGINEKEFPGDPMGTTLTASWIHGGRVHIGHVGDCRAYRVRSGSPEQLTRDHTMSRHILSRAVGIEEKVQMDLYEAEALPGDVYVQCSDGLYPLLSDEELAEIVSRYEPQEACRHLVRLANDRGGPDNITVQVVRI